MLLGAIADDLTGATDLSLTLSREGMTTIQIVGLPDSGFDIGTAQAVVVALKSRTVPVQEAISASETAARWLQARGAEQILFKYCSTFDSTPDGNIGPVAEVLLAVTGSSFTIACPAFPTNGRTVYKGQLFVGDVLLSESTMKDHPLTPMRDSNLVRVLQQQTAVPVRLVTYEAVQKGSDSLAACFAALANEGKSIAIVDALTDDDLRSIGKAAAGLKLVTGGSGVALGLPDNFRRAGKLQAGSTTMSFMPPEGPAVMLAGSCSAATRRQIDHAKQHGVPVLKIDPVAIANGKTLSTQIVEWVKSNGETIPLVYSSTEPSEVRRAQDVLGFERAGQLVENLLADVARKLQKDGYRRFLVAGGETSGAVVESLGISVLRIGPEIDPGVPWTTSICSKEPVALALKSGNFGADDFFLKAWTKF